MVKWFYMSSRRTSSSFTQTSAEQAFGPPMIGALLRIPLEAVQRRMLDQLHEHGFDDLDAPHLNVFQYPGPQGARPSELAARLRVSKQALNYLLGELERSGYLERQPDPRDLRSKRIKLTHRGELAIATIRGAVSELEREWEQQLGPERFAEFHRLLCELAEST